MREYKVNEDRERHLEDSVYNIYNQYNLFTLVKHMQSHIERIDLCVPDTEEARKSCREIYGGKFDMTVFVHYLTLQYLRGLRAYHLRNMLVSKEQDVKTFEEF